MTESPGAPCSPRAPWRSKGDPRLPRPCSQPARGRWIYARIRSQGFSPELAAKTGAIFVFDFHNLRRVLMAHPRAIKRVHPLGALRSDGPLFISDPYGTDAATFDRTLEQIAAAIPGGDQRPAPRSEHRGPAKAQRFQGARTEAHDGSRPPRGQQHGRVGRGVTSHG